MTTILRQKTRGLYQGERRPIILPISDTLTTATTVKIIHDHRFVVVHEGALGDPDIPERSVAGS